MDISIVKETLITQKNIGLSGSLYHKTQIKYKY